MTNPRSMDRALSAIRQTSHRKVDDESRIGFSFHFAHQKIDDDEINHYHVFFFFFAFFVGWFFGCIFFMTDLDGGLLFSTAFPAFTFHLFMAFICFDENPMQSIPNALCCGTTSSKKSRTTFATSLPHRLKYPGLAPDSGPDWTVS